MYGHLRIVTWTEVERNVEFHVENTDKNLCVELIKQENFSVRLQHHVAS